MTSTAEGRVFPEEEPTGKFESETLDALRARSLEKSTVFNATLDGPPPELVTAPYPAARPPMGPTPSSPEFLGKGAPVLVLPSEPPPAAAPLLPVVVAPVPEPAAAIVHAPAPAADPPPAPPAAVPPVPIVERSHRRIRARAVAKPRRRVWRHVFKLALLALVVLCQPWWWNIGDLSSRRPPPPTTTAAK